MDFKLEMNEGEALIVLALLRQASEQLDQVAQKFTSVAELARGRQIRIDNLYRQLNLQCPGV